MPQESKKRKKERAQAIVARLRQTWPEAKCSLVFASDWQLLVAAILSAQCTDERVNKVCQDLFRSYPSSASLAAAELTAIQAAIRSCGLYQNKGKNIKASLQLLEEQYGGVVPADLAALLTFPGCGRKIANLILGECFSIPALVVDTHCLRLSQVLGLTKSSNPVQVERDLAQIVEREHWIAYGHLIVSLGRSYCKARLRNCATCPLADLCPTAPSSALGETRLG